jgi:hypothetical protein
METATARVPTCAGRCPRPPSEGRQQHQRQAPAEPRSPQAERVAFLPVVQVYAAHPDGKKHPQLVSHQREHGCRNGDADGAAQVMQYPEQHVVPDLVGERPVRDESGRRFRHRPPFTGEEQVKWQVQPGLLQLVAAADMHPGRRGNSGGRERQQQDWQHHRIDAGAACQHVGMGRSVFLLGGVGNHETGHDKEQYHRFAAQVGHDGHARGAEHTFEQIVRNDDQHRCRKTREVEISGKLLFNREIYLPHEAPEVLRLSPNHSGVFSFPDRRTLKETATRSSRRLT